jgi:hypothetical protein
MFNAPANYNKITQPRCRKLPTSILQKATGRWEFKTNVEE